MANSKYDYVRSFEQPDTLLSNTWIVVRIDGRGFSKLTTKYKFAKPNDQNGVNLMNAAAEAVMKELPDLVLAYGNSDEYSFVFHKNCTLFDRRASKLTTTIVSTFTSYYVYSWPSHFPDKPLTPPLPSFDGRAVCYPSDFNLRDYMSWRQVDCHINNLYNTTFWTLVQQGGMGTREAEQKLSGTVSADKNEVLFKQFGINYNKEAECFRKGTVLYRDFFPAAQVGRPQTPTLASFPSPPLAHPQPRRTTGRASSQPMDSRTLDLQDQVVLSGSSGPGPTFLSTTSTPSPPPSPAIMRQSDLPNPLRSNPVSPRTSTYPPISTMPLSPPSTITPPFGNLVSPKHHMPTLTPLPLSPLTLKPRTGPPLSLDAPNPTTRENFSPKSPPQDFPVGFPISGYSHMPAAVASRPPSHSASASMSMVGSSQTKRILKHRSPSQPHLPTYFTVEDSHSGPPTIPLRISSIPLNNRPRKLSLPLHRSMSTLKQDRSYSDEKENMISPQMVGSSNPRRVSPPLRTNKELPSPPLTREEELRTREKVNANSLKEKPGTGLALPQLSTKDPEHRQGYVWTNLDAVHPGIAELPGVSTTPNVSSHEQHHPTQISSSLYQPYQGPDVQALTIASLAAAPRWQPVTTSPSSFIPISTRIPSSKLDDIVSPIAPPQDLARSKIQRASTGSTVTPNMIVPCRVKDAEHAFPAGAKESSESTTIPTEAKTQSSNEIRGKAGNREKNKSKQGGEDQDQDRPTKMSKTQRDRDRKKRSKARIMIEHVDIIKDEFWEKRPWILSGKTG
ncbi:tRNA-His guanylyltransferase [Coniothyrium glycines]